MMRKSRKSRAQNQKCAKQEMIHDTYGLVYVKRAIEGSFTKVEIEVMQRAEGWDEASQTYRPVCTKRANENGEFTFYWRRNQRDEFGVIDIVHVRELKAIES